MFVMYPISDSIAIRNTMQVNMYFNPNPLTLLIGTLNLLLTITISVNIFKLPDDVHLIFSNAILKYALLKCHEAVNLITKFSEM